MKNIIFLFSLFLISMQTSFTAEAKVVKTNGNIRYFKNDTNKPIQVHLSTKTREIDLRLQPGEAREVRLPLLENPEITYTPISVLPMHENNTVTFKTVLENRFK